MKMFKILLGLNSIKHLEEKSSYSCNYYELDPYGDWCCFFDGNNIIEAVCHEDEDYYTYTIGHFDGDRFVGVLEWSGEYGETLFSDEEIKKTRNEFTKDVADAFSIPLDMLR